MRSQIILFTFVSSLAFAKPVAPNFSMREAGCMIFTTIAGKPETKTFGDNCKVRTAPCSTFKIALAELGFRNEKLNLMGESFKWDGVKRDREVLNKDQDLYSWMKDSVVWVSTILMSRLGQEQVTSDLKELAYGNATVGPNEFWIKGPLSISVEEQIKYLSRQNDENLKKAISLLPTETVKNYIVSGKTGSCYMENLAEGSRIGWYVGRAKADKKEYSFAIRFLNQKSLKTDKPGGLRAKELFLDWLHQSEQ
jgi:beta-lactamase class D